MRGHPHAPRQPSWKLRRHSHQFSERSWRELPLQNLKSGLDLLRPELPTRRVAKFDHLFAQAHLSGATGRQIDRPDRHLRRKAQGVGGRSATRDDRLSPLTGERFDRLFYGRRASAKPARDREKINTATSPQQLASLSQTRQSLIHCGAIAEVKQAFSRNRRAFRQFRRVRKNLFAQALHG
jgi:hypothetical protein